LKVLLLNEKLDKEDIKPKYIQISRKCTIKDLKHKIIRVISNKINKNNDKKTESTKLNGDDNKSQINSQIEYTSNNVHIYKSHNLSKKILFEMTFSYTNKSKSFILFGQEYENEDLPIPVCVNN